METPLALRRYTKVTVVGAGTIGSSWAALFLAHGLPVCVYDVRPDIAEVISERFQQMTATLTELGLPTHGLTQRLSFESDLERAVAEAEVIQESGPEDLAAKQDLHARIERACPAGALRMSSSSALPASDIGLGLARPNRLLVAHPFTPPLVVPLVEIAPGPQTDPEAVQEAVDFFTALGKAPVVLKKESKEFVVNRLQHALFREAIRIVQEGIVDPVELDTAVMNSVGSRWAAGGPFLSFHLGGGPGGIAHWFETIARQLADDATRKAISDQVMDAYGAVKYDELERQRSHRQIAILRAMAENPYDLNP